jgi:predicted PurR-regulated permease PerM
MASLLTTFLAAFILAYVLRPLSMRLLGLGLGKTLAAILTVFIGFLSLLGLLILFLSVLQKELPALRHQLPIWLEQLKNVAGPWLNHLAINLDIQQIQSTIQSKVSAHLSNNADTLITQSLSTLLNSGQTILSSIVGFVLIIFVVFYLIIQWDEFFKKLSPVIPPRWLAQTQQIFSEIDELLSQYLRGQLLVITVLAVFYSVGLSLLGMTGALALGLFSGLAIFIPYIGYGVALILALLSALLQAETGVNVFAILGLYIAGQVLESFLLTPKLVGDKIGLHPVLVIFSLMLFGGWFGFFGVLLALPISAILLVLSRHLLTAYKNSSWYQR